MSTDLLSNTGSSRLSELDDEFQYRALSVGAIIAAIFGVLSLLMFVAGKDSLDYALMLSPLPLVGLAVGLKAISTIRQTPDQLSGRNLAITGTVLSALSFVGGLGYAGYVHATEVPPGYVRTSFYDFRPGATEARANLAIPRDVQALDGKKVFIKGYMRQDSTKVRHNVRQFLLVRDSNECCFGDLSNVKFYDQVKVQFVDNVTTDYSPRLFRIGGTLKIHPQHVAQGVGSPVYTMQADYVQ